MFKSVSKFAATFTTLAIAALVAVVGPASAQTITAQQERAQLRAMGLIDEWSCAQVSNLSTRTGRLAYVWTVGYVTGRQFPQITGAGWRSATPPASTPFTFDEAMVDAIQGYCLLHPENHLGEIRFTQRQEVAMARLIRLLSSYKWQDLAMVQVRQGVGRSAVSHRTRSVLLDGFIAGQYTADRTADQIVAQGSAPWMCDAFEAMAADPTLNLHEAAAKFFNSPANAAYHRISCERANYALLLASGQMDRSFMQRARSAGQRVSLPRAIDPGPAF